MLSSYGLKFHLYFLDFLNFLLHQRVLHRGLYHVISWVLNKKIKILKRSDIFFLHINEMF
uniref:Uncharacterized protein n=1 Tax=Anguilla anguilla TaxID=7936 RepID=A0A0E9T4Q9_ANGAN